MFHQPLTEEQKHTIAKRYQECRESLSVEDTETTLKQELGHSRSTIREYRDWPNVARRKTEPTVPMPFVTYPSDARVELTRECTTEAFISDVHWHPEYGLGHDPAAYAVVLELLKETQPDILFFGGDVLDVYAASRFEKEPRLGTPEAFDGEIHYGKQRIAEICKLLPNARKIWLTGNHELRVPKRVLTNAPWLMNKIRDVESLLNLDSFGIETVEDGYKIGKLRHYHGHNLAGGGRVNAAKNKFERMLTNMIYGHLHKFAAWYQRDQDGGYFGAFGNGCLQWLSTDYAPNPDWTQGISFVQYAKSGSFHIDQVLVHKPSVWSPHAEVIYAGRHLKVDMQK